MAKKERSTTIRTVEIQKGPINLDEQYTNNFRRQPEAMIRDIENNAMRHDKMTLTTHIPKV